LTKNLTNGAIPMRDALKRWNC